MCHNPKICICGGGNIAHSLAFAFSAINDLTVLTRKQSEWNNQLCAEIGLSHVKQKSKYRIYATDDATVVSKVDCVIVSLPRFAIDSVIAQIKDKIHSGQVVVFIPAPAGMEPFVEECSCRGIDVIGFQRVPYVSRIIEYGKVVWVSDVRSEHKLAFTSQRVVKRWSSFFAKCFGGKIKVLASFWSFTFSNSNPLLHPSRLVPLLKEGKYGKYDRCPYFYAEWTDESSELYVEADREMYRVFSAYAPDAAKTDYESALAHYEVTTKSELTAKIRGIESLKQILAPWKRDEYGTWIPDFDSRYFIEDIPFGTKVIQRYARKIKIATPVIDSMIAYIEKRCS